MPHASPAGCTPEPRPLTPNPGCHKPALSPAHPNDCAVCYLLADFVTSPPPPAPRYSFTPHKNMILLIPLTRRTRKCGPLPPARRRCHGGRRRGTGVLYWRFAARDPSWAATGERTENAPVTTKNPCQCLIGGRWTAAETERFDEIWNPSTGEVIGQTPLCGARDVDRAVQAAKRAFPPWRETPVTDRARIMFRFQELLTRHTEEVARICSREHGKTLAESRASVQRGVEMLEFACGIPSLFTGDIVENLAPGVDSETVRHPLGICVGITPFNFPAMVPLWMYPVALTCGNCFILKPSPRVPLSSIRIAELLHGGGLAGGRFFDRSRRQGVRGRVADASRR